MPAAVRSLRTAAIERLEDAVTLVNGRVYTLPVPLKARMPYLVVGSYSENPNHHYGWSGSSEAGFDVRGVARLVSGPTDAPAGDSQLLALWEQIEAALMDYEITPEGFEPTVLSVRLFRTYAEPGDPMIWHIVGRCDATVVA